MNKRRLKLVTFLLVSAMLMGMFSMFAMAVDPVEILVELPDAAISSGQTFTATVRFADPSVLSSQVVAGIQIEIGYDGSKLSTDSDKVTIDSKLTGNGANKSLTLANVLQTEKKVIFVAVKDTFTETSGYTSDLSGIFNVSFKALENIANAYENITFTTKIAVLGDAKADEVPSVVNVSKLTAGMLGSLAISPLTYVENPQFNGAALGGAAVTNITENLTLTALRAKFNTSASQEIRVKNSSGTYLNNTDRVGSGMTIELWDGGVLADSAVAIVKGDITADGFVNVFDAIEILKYVVDPTYPLSNVMKFAGKLAGTGDITVFDAIEVLKYVVNASW